MPEYIDTLIADAIRPEANNKITVLGLLGDALFVPAVPTALATLAIIQRWRPTPREAPGTNFAFSFEIHGPGFVPIVVAAQTLTVPVGPRPNMNFVVQIQGFPVPQEGDYEIRTLIDGVPQHTYQFFIGVPPQNQRDRLLGFRP